MPKGRQKPVVMGSYGIGSGRAAATIMERCFDGKRIWPVEVAPFAVSLLTLGKSDDAVTNAAADKLYAELTAAGIDVLYDDRDERAGVKFDADLMGNPIRISVSPRTLKESTAELKSRTEESAASCRWARSFLLSGRSFRSLLKEHIESSGVPIGTPIDEDPGGADSN